MESHARMTDLHVDEIKKQVDSMNSTLNQYVEEENNEKVFMRLSLKQFFLYWPRTNFIDMEKTV